MGKKFKSIDTALLEEMADIKATVEALGLPVACRNGKYGIEYQVLNVFRDDKNLGSCYFSRREEDGSFSLTDWADMDSAKVHVIKKDGSEASRPADIIDYVRKARDCSFKEACAFIAEASGLSSEAFTKELDADDAAAEAKRKAALRAQKEKNRRIAALLGLEHTEKILMPNGKEDIRTVSAPQKAEYRHFQCWLDKVYIASVEDGYDYHIRMKDRHGRIHDGWVPAERLARQTAKKIGAKVMVIDRIEFTSSMADYSEAAYGRKHREFFRIIDEKPGKLPADIRDDGPGYVYVLYREPWKPTLTELQAEDPEMYEAIISGKKQEALENIEAEMQDVRNTVFDKDQYDSLMSTLEHRKGEILSI